MVNTYVNTNSKNGFLDFDFCGEICEACNALCFGLVIIRMYLIVWGYYFFLWSQWPEHGGFCWMRDQLISRFGQFHRLCEENQIPSSSPLCGTSIIKFVTCLVVSKPKFYVIIKTLWDNNCLVATVLWNKRTISENCHKQPKGRSYL